MKPQQIKKASGKIEDYEVGKLKKSIRNVGLSEQEAVEIIEEFEDRKRKNGISTRQLHYETFQLIRKRSNASAARYNIKKAVSELGPTGYPFERFFGAILSQLGYRTEVGILLAGNCLTHEVDVLADKGNDRIMVECKFRNRDFHKIDVKIALYIQARFQDLSKKWRHQEGVPENHIACIATNARFSEDAIKYGDCMKMLLVSWDYPKTKQNLKNLIDDTGMYPLTCLTTLTKAEKQALLNKEFVLVKELLNNDKAFEHLQITNRKFSKVKKEIQALCAG
jgi:hypothetical protein